MMLLSNWSIHPFFHTQPKLPGAQSGQRLQDATTSPSMTAPSFDDQAAAQGLPAAKWGAVSGT
jgi:hypothetical protein